MKTSRYYMTRLQKYFDKYWSVYGESAGWLVNPTPNTWQFVIEELGVKVTLVCSDAGVVTESTELLILTR